MREIKLEMVVRIDNKVFCNQECDMLIRTSFGKLCVLNKEEPKKLQYEGVEQTSRTDECLKAFK